MPYDMTPEKVRERVEAIRKYSQYDDEAAHSSEDGLHQAVLSAIAEGRCSDPVECARLALTTKEISFERWCA